MTQSQFRHLGHLSRRQAALQAKFFAAREPEREALALELEQVAAKIEALGDVVLRCRRPGRKLMTEYSFLTQRQRKRRVGQEIPLGDQVSRVTVVPRDGCLHGLQVG